MRDIVELTREAGGFEPTPEFLARLVELVRTDERAEHEADKVIIEYHEATIKRLEALLKGEREAVIGLLRGIDQTQTESADGWWETSTGAEFGAGRIAAIRARGKP